MRRMPERRQRAASERHAPEGGPRTSRRSFLKRSTAAAGATLAAGLAIGRVAHAAGSDVLKIGLIGCGPRGTGAAVNAMNADENSRLVAMADVFGEVLQASRQNLQNLKGEQVAVDDDHCFTGFDGYQRLIASGVDVVLMACLRISTRCA